MNEAGRLARTYAWLVIHLRLVFVLAWVAAAVGAAMLLPSTATTEQEGIGQLVASSAPAVRAEAASLRLFDVPVLARVIVVQRDPHGLPSAVQQQVVERAYAIDHSPQPVLQRPIAGAVPVLNALRAFPGSREDVTTAITYLMFPPDRSVADQVALAERYARGVSAPAHHLVGVTGPIPARQAQTDLILAWLPWVEAVTVALVALVLGLYF